MKWLIMVLIMTLCIMMVICYSLLVIAHDADARAEQMRKERDEKRYNQKV